MKIDGNNEITHSATADKTAPKEATPDAEFKNILKASVEHSMEHPVKIQSPPQPNPVAAIRFMPLSSATRETTVERVDNLLNLLDHYRNQLADPKVTLRSIEPIVSTITKEKEQLSAVLDTLPNDDDLKNIVHRTLIAASLEVMKYNRGDYIPA